MSRETIVNTHTPNQTELVQKYWLNYVELTYDGGDSTLSFDTEICEHCEKLQFI